MTFEFNETSLLVDNPFFDQRRGSTSLEIVCIAKSYIYTKRIEFSPFPVNPLSVFTFHRSPHASLKIVSRCPEINATSRIRTARYHRIILISRSWNQSIFNASFRSIEVSFSTKPRRSSQFYIIFKRKKISFPLSFLNSRKKKKKINDRYISGTRSNSTILSLQIFNIIRLTEFKYAAVKFAASANVPFNGANGNTSFLIPVVVPVNNFVFTLHHGNSVATIHALGPHTFPAHRKTSPRIVARLLRMSDLARRDHKAVSLGQRY